MRYPRNVLRFLRRTERVVQVLSAIREVVNKLDDRFEARNAMHAMCEVRQLTCIQHRASDTVGPVREDDTDLPLGERSGLLQKSTENLSGMASWR